MMSFLIQTTSEEVCGFIIATMASHLVDLKPPQSEKMMIHIFYTTSTRVGSEDDGNSFKLYPEEQLFETGMGLRKIDEFFAFVPD